MPVVTVQLDRDKAANLTVYGGLTIRTAGQLVDAFDKLLNQDVTTFTVNLSKVAYLDSTGISCLLRMKQKLDSVSGKFRLVEVTEAAMEIFRVTRLDAVLPLEPALDPPPAKGPHDG